MARAWHYTDPSEPTLTISPIKAIRFWRPSAGLLLRSSAKRYNWTQGINKAYCMRDDPFLVHEVPRKTCGCGFWGTKGLDYALYLVKQMYPEVLVMGEIEMWGKVCEFRSGYRAELARVTALLFLPSQMRRFKLVDHRQITDIAAHYDVHLREVSEKELLNPASYPLSGGTDE